MADIGRPRTTDTEYQKMLDDMTPFLKLGETLYHAICDAGLERNKTTIYDKYRENDWFAEKIDAYRSYPGKLANNILVKTLLNVDERIKQGLPPSDEDMRNVRFMAEKHRTAQSYFVTRTETAEADPDKVGKILDTIESDYAKLGESANMALNEKNQTQGQDKQDGNS